MSRRGFALFAAMCVIWGIPYLLIKVVVVHTNPITLVWMRTIVGAVLLLPIAIRRVDIRELFKHWPMLIAYSAVEVAIPWVLLSSAETRISSSLAGLMVAAVPLFGVAMSLVTHQAERFSMQRIAGLLVGLLGVGVLLGFDFHVDDIGALFAMLGVAVGYAAGPQIIALRLREVSSLGVIVFSLVATAIVYTPFAVFHMPKSLPPDAIVSLAALGVVCTALAFVVFFALIAEIGPVRSTVITYVNPAVAVVLGIVVLHEAVTATTLFAFALILVGCLLATGRIARPIRR